MSSQQSTMRSSVFDPAIASGSKVVKSTGAKSRLSIPVKYYTFSTKPATTDILNVMLMCALAGSSTTTSQAQWKSLLATYTNVLFDGLVTKLPSDQYEPVSLTEENLQHLREVYTIACNEEDNAMDGTATPHAEDFAAAFRFPSCFLPIPTIPLNCGWITYNRDQKALVAHYSMIVFLAGKQIDNKNRVAITEKRPKAVIEKFKIDATDLLYGPLRLSDAAHEQINQAWLEMTSLKATCFREFATYTHRETDLQQDIILTTVNLMRHMQMQHAVMIYKFTMAYPWVKDFGPLQKYLSIFHNSVASAAAVDEHLQPFIKVIYGDKSGIFPRKELGPLIACALSTEQELNDTLSQYYHDDAFGSIVEAFMEERQRRAPKAAEVAAEQIETMSVDEDIVSL